MARIASDGTARPMLSIHWATTPPRRMWPSQAARGMAMAALMAMAVRESRRCS